MKKIKPIGTYVGNTVSEHLERFVDVSEYDKEKLDYLNFLKTSIQHLSLREIIDDAVSEEKAMFRFNIYLCDELNLMLDDKWTCIVFTHLFTKGYEISYMGYTAKVVFNENDNMFHGAVENIGEFKTDNSLNIESEFHNLVNNYTRDISK